MKKSIKKRINKKKKLSYKKIIVGILILALIYLLFKVVYLKIYNVNNYIASDFKEVYESINNYKGTIIIDEANNKTEEYLEYRNLKIKNNFKDFEEKTDPTDPNTILYYLYDDNYKDNIKASLYLGIYKSYIDMFIEGIDKEENDKGITSKFREKIIKKNNIKNDMEFLKFIKKYQNKKSNIFTSIKKIKEIYSIQYFVSRSFPKQTNSKLIDGDYKGYIYETEIKDNYNNTKMVYATIIKNNKRYLISFIGRDNYFNNEDIENLLKSIVIE